MKIFIKASVFILAVSLGLALNGTALAAVALNLGTAGNFAVLGGSTVTNTGSTVINGDLGLSPGTSVTGFPPGTVNGTQHVTDSAAAQAQADLVTAYNAAAGQTGASTLSGDLGGRTLTPGVYNSAAALGLTGTLTLDGQGNPNAVFIFQIGSALTVATGANVALTNGAQPCNIFWQVASSATLGTNSNFSGSILTLSSITVTTGAVVNGRVLARNGAVTLDTNSINKSVCTVAAAPAPSPAPTTTPVVIVPTSPTAPAVTVAPTPTSAVVAPVPTAITMPAQSTLAPIPGLPKTGINPKNSQRFPWQFPLFILAGLAIAAVFVKKLRPFLTK